MFLIVTCKYNLLIKQMTSNVGINQIKGPAITGMYVTAF